MNADDIRMLSYEQKKKYQAAIAAGYFGTYDVNPRKWRHTFVGAFLWKYPGRVKMMKIMENILEKIPTWEDMTDNFLKDVVEELKEQNLAPSSVRTMCAELKSVLNDNFSEVPCDKNQFGRILSIRNTASQSIYLTREEIQRIANYVPTTDVQEYVQRNFMVGAMTGARLVDASNLTISNCDHLTGILSYIPKKTPGVVVRVPVDERIGVRKFLVNERKRNMCTDVFNENLRIICRNCGLNTLHTIFRANKSVTEEKWKLVSSHTARRSFATNLFLSGVSLEDIAMMMGHGKNIETTMRYICAERKVTPAIVSYFQPVTRTPSVPGTYYKVYNKAIDDVLEILNTTEFIPPDSFVYKEITALRKT